MTLQNYAEFVFSNNDVMSDPEPDVCRIAGLHSWYKHLNSNTIAYPLLQRGEEPRYSFDHRYTDPNQDNFHWTVVMDVSLKHYHANLGSGPSPIPHELKEFMKKFPIELNPNFSNVNLEVPNILRKRCTDACVEFWNELHSFYQNSELEESDSEPEEILSVTI